MLPGDAPAGGHAGLYYGCARLDHAIQFTRHAHVEKDIGVQIAVAGVEDISDFKTITLTDFGDFSHDLGQPATRHYSILNIVIGRQGPQRAKGLLAPFPQELPLGLALGHPYLARAIARANGLHQSHAPLGVLAHALQLNQENGGRVARVACRPAPFHRFDGQLIHHLQGRRDDSRRRDIHNALRGGIHVVKNRQQRAHRFSCPHQPHPNLGDDPHGPFGADEEAAEVVARRVGNLAAEPDHLSVVQHHLDA